MARTKQPTMAVCHPTLPAYAHQLCRRCYDSKRWSGKLPTSVSGEAREMAERVAGPVPRADRKRFEESGYVRTSDPAVAQHVASAIAKNLLDTEAAVRELKPELDSYEVSQVVAKLQKDPHVQAAVQTELKRLGLDAESKEKYIQLLWRYAASEAPEHEKRQLTSLRLLGKAFLPEQVQIEAPETLPLRGLDEGLKRMGLGDDVVATLGPTNPVEIEDDNESLGFDA
jgi:hypothetical protein